jgi:hypothetical protein
MTEDLRLLETVKPAFFSTNFQGVVFVPLHTLKNGNCQKG